MSTISAAHWSSMSGWAMFDKNKILIIFSGNSIFGYDYDFLTKQTKKIQSYFFHCQTGCHLHQDMGVLREFIATPARGASDSEHFRGLWLWLWSYVCIFVAIWRPNYFITTDSKQFTYFLKFAARGPPVTHPCPKCLPFTDDVSFMGRTHQLMPIRSDRGHSERVVVNGDTCGHHQHCHAPPPSRLVTFRVTAVWRGPSATVPPSKAAMTLLHCARKEGTVVRVALCLGCCGKTVQGCSCGTSPNRVATNPPHPKTRPYCVALWENAVGGGGTTGHSTPTSSVMSLPARNVSRTIRVLHWRRQADMEPLSDHESVPSMCVCMCV